MFKKRFLWLISIGLMMMVLIIPCAAAKLVGFSDVTQNHWAYSAIMDMTAEGIFHGTGAVNSHGIGQFSPNILMKRSEFLTTIVRYLYPDQLAQQSAGAIWYRAAYDVALEQNLLYPAELDYGILDQPISRQEMALLLARAVGQLGYDSTTLISPKQIPDWNSIASEYRESVQIAYTLGLLSGMDKSGTFQPNAGLTRAAAATVMQRLIRYEQVDTVRFTHNISGDTGEYAVIEGCNAAGQVIWRYTTESYAPAQLNRVGEIGSADDIFYFFEDNNVIAMYRNSGTILWRNSTGCGSPIDASFIDEDHTLYISGSLGPDLLMIDRQGNTVYHIEFFYPNSYYWPIDLQKDGDWLTILFEVGNQNYSDTGNPIYFNLVTHTYQTTYPLQ